LTQYNRNIFLKAICKKNSGSENNLTDKPIPDNSGFMIFLNNYLLFQY